MVGRLFEELEHPHLDLGVPNRLRHVVMAGDEPVERVLAVGEESAVLVGLQHDLDRVGPREEGQLHLVRSLCVPSERGELDLLEERELLTAVADVPELEVRRGDRESEPTECLQDRFLHRQRVYGDGVEVASVSGACYAQFRTDPHADTKWLPVQLSDGRLPRHREREGQTALIFHCETEAGRQGGPVEDDQALGFAVGVLGCHLGDQLQRDASMSKSAAPPRRCTRPPICRRAGPR